MREILSCPRCKDLLFQPVSLPCAGTVCQACFESQLSLFLLATGFYPCPAPNCRQRHLYRNEKPNLLLAQLCEKLFPRQFESFRVYRDTSRSVSVLLEKAIALVKIGQKLKLSEEEIEILEKLASRLHGSYIDITPNVQPRALCIKLLFLTNRTEEATREAINLFLSSGCELTLMGCIEFFRRAQAGFEHLQTKTEGKQSDPSVSLDFPKDSIPDELRLELLEPFDFECTLCLNQLSDIVSLPCGHTWCKHCILQAHEVCRKCPMCRACLPSYSYISNYTCRKNAITACLERYTQYRSVRNESVSSANTAIIRDVPIFVCSLAYPSGRYAFHLFEPRYRVSCRAGVFNCLLIFCRSLYSAV